MILGQFPCFFGIFHIKPFDRPIFLNYPENLHAAHESILGLTREQYDTWQQLGRQIRQKLEQAVTEGLRPESDAGQEVTQLHRRWLTITGNQYDEARHKGLAELYVADARFTAYYDVQVPGCARFLRDAVFYWAGK